MPYGRRCVDVGVGWNVNATRQYRRPKMRIILNCLRSKQRNYTFMEFIYHIRCNSHAYNVHVVHTTHGTACSSTTKTHHPSSTPRNKQQRCANDAFVVRPTNVDKTMDLPCGAVEHVRTQRTNTECLAKTKIFICDSFIHSTSHPSISHHHHRRHHHIIATYDAHTHTYTSI